jgi:hypothetical protein
MRGKTFLGILSLFRSTRREALAVNPRPRNRFGDLGRSRLAGDHCQVRNPHQHLKIGSYDMKVAAVIIGVGAQTGGARSARLVIVGATGFTRRDWRRSMRSPG